MALLILFLMLLVMLMRVVLPRGAKRAGKTLMVVRLTLIERFLMQRVNLYCIGGTLLLMTLTHSIQSGSQFIVLLVAQALLLIPVRCHLTSDGMGVNNVVFRPWSDFAGFRVEQRRIVLAGREGTRPLNLHILADNQKAILPTLRRHLTELESRKEVRRGTTVTAR